MAGEKIFPKRNKGLREQNILTKNLDFTQFPIPNSQSPKPQSMFKKAIVPRVILLSNMK